jgi:hypothetical protein
MFIRFSCGTMNYEMRLDPRLLRLRIIAVSAAAFVRNRVQTFERLYVPAAPAISPCVRYNLSDSDSFGFSLYVRDAVSVAYLLLPNSFNAR